MYLVRPSAHDLFGLFDADCIQVNLLILVTVVGLWSCLLLYAEVLQTLQIDGVCGSSQTKAQDCGQARNATSNGDVNGKYRLGGAMTQCTCNYPSYIERLAN